MCNFKILALLLLTSIACGEQDEFKTHRNADSSETNGSVSDTKPSASSADAERDVEEDKNGKPIGTEKPGEGEIDDRGSNGSGLAFFEQKVLPIFQAQCVSCHADPRQVTEIRGPLTIYSYDAMKAKLVVGNSSRDNDLIDKITNKVSHEGGDRCLGNMEISPCKEIATWHITELGDGQTKDPAVNVAGRIFEVTPLGRVIGWAYNPNDTTEELSVVFYIDGASGKGTKLGPLDANRNGPDNNTPGNHAFLLDVPLEFRDKKKHTLHAYALINDQEVELGQPYEFTSYAPSEAGRAFYNANVANAVNGCGGCHALSYEQHFYALVSPAPSQGGTAANNVLINKAGTRNGTAHGGGNRCVGGNPCNVFQQWWQQEFAMP